MTACQSTNSSNNKEQTTFKASPVVVKNPAPVFSSKVSSKKGGTITSPKGTVFEIPANGFVNAKGEVVEGDVSIDLKEYKKPEDILLSGIPMTYQNVVMESDGMFDLQANVNGEAVQLASGKSIEVNMPANDTTKKDYKLFYLDPKTKTWSVKTEKLQAKKKEAKKKKLDTIEVIFEWSELSYFKRTKDGKTFYLFPIPSRELAVGTLDKVNDTTYTYLDASSPVYKDYSIGTDQSKSQLKSLAIATSTFPELSYYKNMVWNISDDSEWKKMNAFCKNDTVVEAKIVSRQFPGNSFLVALKGKKYTSNVVLDYVSSNDSYAENREMYMSLLQERPYDEQNTKVDKDMLNRNKNSMLLQYSFSISKLGIWNCDRLYMMPKQAKIDVKFLDGNKQAIKNPSTIYLIDKKLNSVISYYTSIITYNPDSRSMLFFMNEAGNLCYVKPDELSGLKPGEKELSTNFIELENINSTEQVREVMRGL